jgi:hypothetical protein
MTHCRRLGEDWSSWTTTPQIYHGIAIPRSAMRARPSLRVRLSVLFALCSAGCTSRTPPPTTLPPREPDAPRAASFVVEQEVPPLVARDPALVAAGTPVFQVVHDADLKSLDISRDGSLPTHSCVARGAARAWSAGSKSVA